MKKEKKIMKYENSVKISRRKYKDMRLFIERPQRDLRETNEWSQSDNGGGGSEWSQRDEREI